MKIKGKVVIVLGDNIDTDLIYPGRFLNITDKLETPKHLFEMSHPDLRAKIQNGNIIVAGANFGCGSSREQATAAIKYANIGAVIAKSFARIFYRNSINLGLPLIISQDAAKEMQESEEIEIDFDKGKIKNLTSDKDISAISLPKQALELIEGGGLIASLQKKYGK
ncbi:MAG: 3-isopropylmalate dehydratase small subunit [Elusimicrobia bacterium]|nr:3-isopropylmalate dehydratase small subunit [Elusimicrobiota bacterium]